MSTTKPADTSTRIWTRTVRKLRLIAALSGERIVAVLDRLADAELARLRESEQHGTDGNDGNDTPQDL
jgi:hypothetical protein